MLQTEAFVAALSDDDNDLDLDDIPDNATGIDIVNAKEAVAEEYVLASCSNLLSLSSMKPPTLCYCGNDSIMKSSCKFGTSLVISRVSMLHTRDAYCLLFTSSQRHILPYRDYIYSHR